MRLSDIYAPGATIGESATLSSFIAPIIQNAIIVIGIFSFITLILAGFRYVSNAGNEKEISTASNTITYALIGLGVAAVSYVVTKILFAVGGVGGIF